MLPGTKEYKELRRLINMDIPTDTVLGAITGRIEIDMPALDIQFSEYDEDYNHSAGTYKSLPCSMSQYIERKFGKKAIQIFNQLAS